MKRKVNYEHIYTTAVESFKYRYYNVSINDSMPLHQHPEWEVSFILKGKGSLLIGNDLKYFGEGNLTLVPPHIPHCWIFDKSSNEERTESITIQFRDELISSCLSQLAELTQICHKIYSIGQSRIIQGNAARIISQHMIDMNTQTSLKRLCSFLEIISLIANCQEYIPIGQSETIETYPVQDLPRIEKVYRYISANYMYKITLKDIASVASMSETAFCTFFKQITRQSFSAFLAQYRIEMAVKLLFESNTTISDICFAVGFNDIPHFNRTFKKLKGYSPKEYYAKIISLYKEDSPARLSNSHGS